MPEKEEWEMREGMSEEAKYFWLTVLAIALGVMLGGIALHVLGILP